MLCWLTVILGLFDLGLFEFVRHDFNNITTGVLVRRITALTRGASRQRRAGQGLRLARGPLSRRLDQARADSQRGDVRVKAFASCSVDYARI